MEFLEDAKALRSFCEAHALENKVSLEVSDELISLEHRRVTIEERQQQIKKREKDLQKSQDSLSMCASVTQIIPDLNDQTKISGFVVERSNRKVDKFEFDPTTPPYEVCNSLWKMASH
ncbi:hypothetical protein HPP92_011088 [Vanilla planifolia]|uniref:Uncharacterized protein n=1 Tax=Vanilla planifolia TaxID=51239 RepID=A0A835R259_VANPL|nr:hypothetical protein HPP92_011088 [Vanilla planifolia]